MYNFEAFGPRDDYEFRDWPYGKWQQEKEEVDFSQVPDGTYHIVVQEDSKAVGRILFGTLSDEYPENTVYIWTLKGGVRKSLGLLDYRENDIVIHPETKDQLYPPVE